MSQAQPPLALRLTLSVVALVLFVCIAELLLGLIGDRLYHEDAFFPHAGDIDFYEVFQKDTDRFWRFTANRTTESRLYPGLTYQYNSAGMRGDDFSAEKNGFRVVLLGNSCTFGWGVRQKETFATQLSTLLNAGSPDQRCEVINAGVPGYTAHQGKVYLQKELLDLKPDAAVVMFGWNDHWAAVGGRPDSQQEMPAQLLLDVQNFASRFNIYRFLRWAVRGVSSEKESASFDSARGVRRVPPQEFFENLRSIVDIAHDNGIEPILAIPPVASADGYFGGQTCQLHQLHSNYQEQIRRAAAYTGARLVDLQSLFDVRTDLYDDAMADPIHFNACGHQVVAAAISEQIFPLVRPKRFVDDVNGTILNAYGIPNASNVTARGLFVDSADNSRGSR